MEAIKVVLKCLEKVDCECLEQVVEDVEDGCAELLGLDVTQECINVADKAEVRQYTYSTAPKALDASGYKECAAGNPEAGR